MEHPSQTDSNEHFSRQSPAKFTQKSSHSGAPDAVADVAVVVVKSDDVVVVNNDVVVFAAETPNKYSLSACGVIYCA